MNNLRIKKVKNENNGTKKRITLFLQGLDGAEIEGKIWGYSLEDLTPEFRQVFMTGNYIKLVDYEFNSNYGTYTIRQLELESYGKRLSEKAKNKMFTGLILHAEALQDARIQQNVIGLLNFYENELKNYPASYQHHHNYQGGLLKHTYECIEFADSIIPKVQGIDPDLVIAGILIHDVFKVREYQIDPETGLVLRVNKSSLFGENSRHIAEVTTWALQLDENLAHIVASHHGKKEWGALVEPQTKEAHLVHQCDMLSTFTGAVTIDELPQELVEIQ